MWGGCWVQIRGVLECSTHRWGSGGLVARLHGSEPAATSMLGNFTLIRENKEGVGLRWGGHTWGRQACYPRRPGVRERGWGDAGMVGPLGALPMFVN